MPETCLAPGESTGDARRPFFLPGMASWVRPVWFATWAAQVYSAFVLLPVWLPVYDDLLPVWVWIGVPVQLFVELGVAAYLDIRKRQGAHAWAVAGIATMGTTFIFSVGLHVLMTYQLTVWEILGLAAFGVFCLGFLVALERFGFGFVPETTAPVREAENLRGAPAPAVPQPAIMWSDGIPWWVLLGFVVVMLATVAAVLLMF